MAESKPWTKAMLDALDAQAGGSLTVEEVLKVGAEAVPEERALQEMKSRSPEAPDAKRVERGRRTVAQQSLHGMKRFNQVMIDRKKNVTLVREDGVSNGDLAHKLVAQEEEIAALRARLARIEAKLGLSPLDEVPEEPVKSESTSATMLKLFGDYVKE